MMVGMVAVMTRVMIALEVTGELVYRYSVVASRMVSLTIVVVLMAVIVVAVIGAEMIVVALSVIMR